MEFRFRAINNQPPAAAAASSSAFFSDHPLQDDSAIAELEKQRIREEIMIREIVNRRMLEARIRMELIVEQELAMLRATGRTSTERLAFDEHFATPLLLDQRLNHQSSSRGLSVVPSFSSSIDSLLPDRPFSEAQKEEMKPLVDEKLKLTYLPKPDPEKFKTKRKAEGPPTEAEIDHTNTDPIPSTLSLKKLREEEELEDHSICTQCEINITGQTTFNSHLQISKNHTAKLSKGQRTGDDDDGDVLSNKTTSPSKEIDGSKLDSSSEKLALDEKKGYFEFWCEICKIGTRSLVAMEMHSNGRKHRARVLKHGQGKLEDEQKMIAAMSPSSL